MRYQSQKPLGRVELLRTTKTPCWNSVYNMNLVGFRRINTTHLLSETDSTLNPITYDSYTIKVDMSSNGVDRSASGTGDSQDSTLMIPIWWI